MRAVRHWHRLPTEVTDAPSLEMFRARIDGTWSKLVQWKGQQDDGTRCSLRSFPSQTIPGFCDSILPARPSRAFAHARTHVTGSQTEGARCSVPRGRTRHCKGGYSPKIQPSAPSPAPEAREPLALGVPMAAEGMLLALSPGRPLSMLGPT